jgi:nucleoside-diphosphate-sugar epimerase
MSGARVLLTGARGFVGRHALARLAADERWEVHAITSGTPPSAPAAARGVRWHQLDLLDAAAAEVAVAAIRPTHLLHMAWYTEHGKFWNADVNTTWLDASERLVQAFAAAGGSRAVLAGTMAEYEWGHELCSEKSTPTVPASLYGRSKLELARRAAHIAAEDGVSLAEGRIFLTFGPDEDERRFVPHVLRSLLAGRKAGLSHGRQIRDFLYAPEAAGAFVALLGSRVEGPVNVASGRPTTLREAALLAADLIGAPHELLDFGAVAAAPSDPPALVADVTRLTQEVGWRPLRTLADGLRETIAGLRARAP